MRLRILCLLSLLASGCVIAPKPTPPPPPAAILPPSAASVKLSAEQIPVFNDDASTASLRTAAYHSLTYYLSRPKGETYMLATDTFTAADMAASLAHFIELLDNAKTPQDWQVAVRRDFDVYQSVGTDPQRTVTFSSYYDPTIPGRLERSEVYRYPIYGRPIDLVDVDLGQFDPVYQGARISGRVVKSQLVPYYTREDIDSKQVLGARAPVIAWAKTPVDIFFLQIEGSGWLDIGGGEKVRIRYAANNSRKYRSVGLHLINSGRIPKDRFSHEAFERYLNDRPRERQSLLNVNPRYVFFTLDRSTSSHFTYGNIQVPLTGGRSMATDPKLFPKGALAWIATDRPVLDAAGKKMGKLEPLTRFILNQDEGGAIQGPGRVDFFAGEGKEAHDFATNFWQKGTLYFLVKKRGK